MLKLSTGLAFAIAAELKAKLDGGMLYIFGGAIPETADEALDVGPTGDVVELVQITVDGDGTTPLTFDAPVGGALAKAAAESWEGTADETGVATFYRFVEALDDPTVAASSGQCRIQGLCGNTPYGYDLVLPNTSIVQGATVPIAMYLYDCTGA